MAQEWRLAADPKGISTRTGTERLGDQFSIGGCTLLLTEQWRRTNRGEAGNTRPGSAIFDQG
jgi:hypothetical protein